MPTIREQLEPLIRAQGISAVAAEADLHRPDLSAWLAGRRRISDDKLDRLCLAIGVRLIARPTRRRPLSR